MQFPLIIFFYIVKGNLKNFTGDKGKMFYTMPMLNNYMMPNLPAYWSLGNRHFVTNFAGSYQHGLYPDSHSPFVYSLAQGFQNPNHISMWNPLLIGFNTGEGMTTNPALTAAGNQSAYNAGLAYAAKSRISSLISTLTSYESQIKNIIKSGKLDEAQEQRLQTILDEIAALKEHISNMSGEQISIETIEAAQGVVIELIKKASETAQGIIQELQEAAQEEADNVSGAGSSDGTDDISGISDVDESGATTNPEIKDEAAGIVGLIYDSVAGPGTKNSQLKQTIAQINCDNITAVFDAWNENYKDNEGSLVKRIYDDEYWINGGNDYVKHMVDAFEEKARELGIYPRLIKEFTTVNSELTAFWNTSERKVSDAMDKIHQTIKQTQADKFSEAKAERDRQKAEAEARKAEAQRKEAERIAMKKSQFVADMREILGDDKAQVSEDVRYENNTFVIRIKGKNYYGKNYLELAKAIEKSGYDPAKYLKKQTATAIA